MVAEPLTRGDRLSSVCTRLGIHGQHSALEDNTSLIAMVMSGGGLGLGLGDGELLLPRNGFTAHANVGRAHTLVCFTNAFLRACPWFVVTPFDSCTFAVRRLVLCVFWHRCMPEFGTMYSVWRVDKRFLQMFGGRFDLCINVCHPDIVTEWPT